ncbi:MAG: hypothetical protein LBD55_12885 [Treponema sp.]|jgi:hypothetical protein|nr:hypothetical protein [Treponema sp.]
MKVEYKVWVETRNKRGAGTDNDVFLQMYALDPLTGAEKTNDEFNLGDCLVDPGNRFEQNDEEWGRKTLEDIGRPHKIAVRISGGLYDAWCGARIYIERQKTPQDDPDDLDINKKVHFEMGRWFEPGCGAHIFYGNPGALAEKFISSETRIVYAETNYVLLPPGAEYEVYFSFMSEKSLRIRDMSVGQTVHKVHADIEANFGHKAGQSGGTEGGVKGGFGYSYKNLTQKVHEQETIEKNSSSEGTKLVLKNTGSGQEYKASYSEFRDLDTLISRPLGDNKLYAVVFVAVELIVTRQRQNSSSKLSFRADRCSVGKRVWGAIELKPVTEGEKTIYKFTFAGKEALFSVDAIQNIIQPKTSDR